MTLQNVEKIKGAADKNVLKNVTRKQGHRTVIKRYVTSYCLCNVVLLRMYWCLRYVRLCCTLSIDSPSY